ncbi:MAG: cytochrome c [Alphaproteobacteria bacterium]|nr:cytochrome c [Alphaproteobacteria bacterium]
MKAGTVGVLSLFLTGFLYPFSAQAGPAEPPVERQAALLYLLKQDCGACHGLRLTGGLGLPLTTLALDGKDNDMLSAIILDGVPGTPMPPWRGQITPAEAAWLVERLKQGATDAP